MYELIFYLFKGLVSKIPFLLGDFSIVLQDLLLVRVWVLSTYGKFPVAFKLIGSKT